jgi:peptidoglycan hydrolase CwlO-like protein
MPTAARLTTLALALVASLALAGAVAADPDRIDEKRAQAEQVLAQIQELDMELELAVDEWNGANVRLEQLEGELAENQRRLDVARANLGRAQTTVEQRLVSLYQGGEVDVVEVVLGATSFDDLLDGLDTASRVAEDDARILEDVRSSKVEVEKQRLALQSALARQKEIVAQRAARRAEIEAGLAERQTLYDSVREEIAVLEAEERRRQARLAAEARRQAAAIERRQAAAARQPAPEQESAEQRPPPPPRRPRPPRSPSPLRRRRRPPAPATRRWCRSRSATSASPTAGAAPRPPASTAPASRCSSTAKSGSRFRTTSRGSTATGARSPARGSRPVTSSSSTASAMSGSTSAAAASSTARTPATSSRSRASGTRGTRPAGSARGGSDRGYRAGSILPTVSA